MKKACEDDHVTLQIWKTGSDEYHVTASSYPLNGMDCAKSMYGEYHKASELDGVISEIVKEMIEKITEG